MGFYGNITNTSKTQFQFDKIYPNRYEMDKMKYQDGIYAGRYVLVEYDTETNLDTFIQVQIRNKIAYYNPVGDNSFQTILKIGDIAKGDIVYVADGSINPTEGIYPKHCIFYVCTSELAEDESNKNEPATFEETVNGNTSTYTINYNIDTDKYGNGRGYDSTVWQKVYIDGIEKYIMIAELNTVVPTFDISADAPTQRPIVPHFDTQSTDVYYKLHWQPSWGFRVKEAEAAGNNSINGDLYPSDEKASHYTYEFNPNTGVNEKNDPQEYAAAIFFNKDGFEKDIRTYYSSEENAENTDRNGNSINGTFGDSIIIEPTGQSGARYNKHDGTSDTEIQPDIQEMRILLPSLGNAISDVWDIIYGYGEKVLHMDGTKTGESSNRTRFRDIEWKDVVNGVEDIENLGGMTRDLNTLAGCINSVHDLMGMIITTKNDDYLNEVGYLNNYIFKDGSSYYRIHQYPIYEQVNVNLPNPDNYESDQQYNEAYEEVVSELTGNYYVANNIEENPIRTVKAFNEKAIIALKEGEVLVRESGVAYEFREIEEFAKNLGTINGCILQMKNLLEVEDSETRDRATVTGAINYLNDIINVFEDLIPGEFLICDANGHVNSANWTTKQAFDYDNILNKSAKADYFPEIKTDENTWLKLSIDETNKLISLTHEFTPIPETHNSSDKNEEQDQYIIANDIKYRGINHKNGDTIDLYSPIVDAMGHVVGNNIETVTLPYGYKTFTTIGNNPNTTTDLDSIQDTVSEDGSVVTAGTAITDSNTVADNTQDSLAVNPYNKWIQISITNDKIELAHEIHGIQTNSLESNLNIDEVPSSLNSDKITFQDLEFDAAGHVTKNQRHTYTLPYGYKVFETKATSTESERDLYTKINNVSGGANTSSVTAAESSMRADNTQDTFKVNPANKWIQMELNDDNDELTIAHEIHSINTESKTSDLNNGTDVITVQDTAYDMAGHIISNNAHTYTLPFGFKNITPAEQSTAVNNPDANTTKISADNTQDDLTIASTNKWIRMSAGENDGNDIFYIGHEVHEIPVTSKTTDWTNEETNTSIPVVSYEYDNAGHFTKHHTETYKLPFGYGKIKGDSGSTAATATYDEVTFASDEWLTATVQEDKVIYSHDYPKKVNDTESETNVNGKGDTIILETLERDEKGHVIKVNQNTVTLPYGYKTFNGDSGTTSANNTQDSLSITGDTWIKTTVSNDKIELSHIEPTGTSTAIDNVEPDFGATFIINDHHFDNRGHKFASTSHTVKLPKPSLTNGTGNVVTKIELTDATKGVFKETRADVGTLLITGYQKPTVLGTQALSNSESLNSALGKLEFRLENEVSERTNAINGLGSAAYTNSNAYATADQGELAASALQKTTIIGNKTVEELLNLVIELSTKVKTLEDKLNEYHPIIEENPEEEEMI